MAHILDTVNLGAGAAKTLDLGQTCGYLELEAQGGEMWVSLSNANTKPAEPAATPAPAAGSDAPGWLRIASGGRRIIGVPYSQGYSPTAAPAQNAQQPAARFVLVWAVGAGTLSVVAH